VAASSKSPPGGAPFGLLTPPGDPAPSGAGHGAPLLRRYSRLAPPGAGERTIRGWVVRWGETASIGGGEYWERFAAGSIEGLPGRYPLNVEHEQGATVAVATVEELPAGAMLCARLPDDDAGRDAWERVRSGELGGLSVEFVALETADVESIRERRRVRLHAVGLVSAPAYAGSVLERSRRRRRRYY